MLHVVLFEPEIPHNTGAISRLCHATGANLHLVKPLGFSLDDKYLKRAGMDYWKEMNVQLWDHWEHLEKGLDVPLSQWRFFTTKTNRSHWDVPYAEETVLVFGPESRGLPEPLLMRFSEQTCRIPMKTHTRSLNLAVSAGIAMYEVLRQTGLPEGEDWA